METLQTIRQKKGLSQEDLALKIGMSQETISQYETGTRRPSITTARKIADVLGVKLDAIFFGADISK